MTKQEKKYINRVKRNMRKLISFRGRNRGIERTMITVESLMNPHPDPDKGECSEDEAYDNPAINEMWEEYQALENAYQEHQDEDDKCWSGRCDCVTKKVYMEDLNEYADMADYILKLAEAVS